MNERKGRRKRNRRRRRSDERVHIRAELGPTREVESTGYEEIQGFGLVFGDHQLDKGSKLLLITESDDPVGAHSKLPEMLRNSISFSFRGKYVCKPKSFIQIEKAVDNPRFVPFREQ